MITNKKEDSQKEIAKELKNAFKVISHFIEKHTSIVCPACEKVCCINKHGNYDNNDVVFIKALGIEIPYYTHDRKDTDPPAGFSKKKAVHVKGGRDHTDVHGIFATLCLRV